MKRSGPKPPTLEQVQAWQRKQRNPLPKVSAKRKSQMNVYSKRRKAFLREHPSCLSDLHGLDEVRSEDIHHVKGRIGELFLNEEFWLPVCRACHLAIHNQPHMARERGLLQ